MMTILICSELGLAPAPDTPEGAFWSGLRADVEAAVERELLLEGLR